MLRYEPFGWIPPMSHANGEKIDDCNQGCGVGVEAGVGVGRTRPFCLASESELESVKFRGLRLRPGVAGDQPSTDNDFWPNGYALPG